MHLVEITIAKYKIYLAMTMVSLSEKFMHWGSLIDQKVWFVLN